MPTIEVIMIETPGGGAVYRILIREEDYFEAARQHFEELEELM